MKRAVLALATVAALMVAPSALAAPQEWQRAAERVALDHWHELPRCGVADFDFSWRDEEEHGGHAFIDRCIIGVDTKTFYWTWPEFCALVVHEYGHLLLYDHKAGTIMDEDVLRPELIPGCMRPPTTRVRVAKIGRVRWDGWARVNGWRGARALRKMQLRKALRGGRRGGQIPSLSPPSVRSLAE